MNWDVDTFLYFPPRKKMPSSVLTLSEGGVLSFFLYGSLVPDLWTLTCWVKPMRFSRPRKSKKERKRGRYSN